MTREEFIKNVNEIRENKCDLCVGLKIPGQRSLEYIVNKNKSIKNKLEYYCNNYDDKMRLISNPHVSVKEVFGCDFYVG